MAVPDTIEINVTYWKDNKCIQIGSGRCMIDKEGTIDQLFEIAKDDTKRFLK